MLPTTMDELNAKVAAYLGERNGVRWVEAYDKIYNDGPTIETARARLTKLMRNAADDGWNMNRQGQCDHIAHREATGETEAAAFFGPLDNLRVSPGLLRRLGQDQQAATRELRAAFAATESTLSGWHPSADTTCFVTKVGLMMVSGEFVAMDRRVQATLQMSKYTTRHGENTVLDRAVKLGAAVVQAEAALGAPLEVLVTAALRTQSGLAGIRQLPLGRAVDMLLF
jgi:hypothetical protein